MSFSRRDLLTALIRSYTPSYELMNDSRIQLLGCYWGGFRDEWKWGDHNHEAPPAVPLDTLSTTHLEEVLEILMNDPGRSKV